MGDPKKLMLIVEDDGWTRTTLASILKHKGWDVLVAPSVAQGLGMLETSQPDCILLDLTLPDGSGEAILRHVRDEGLPTRVVICTSTHESRRLEGVRSLRPDALFVKPIEIDDVLGACGHPQSADQE